MPDGPRAPRIYVLAGTNGAGKSSIAGAMLLRQRVEYFNPDEAARRILAANPGISQTQANSAAWHEGRRLLERELKKYRKTVKKLESEGKFAAELPTWGFSRLEDLYAALGYGKLAPRNVLEKLIPPDELDRPEPPRAETAVSRVVRKILPFGAPDITVVGHNDLLASLAKCCSPVPGERIIGPSARAHAAD